MNIDIKVIPHSEQRYPTVGDWYFRDCVTAPDEEGQHAIEKILYIRVSKMSDPRYEFLVALHELIEVKLCEWAGITQDMVDEFDKKFEANRHPDNIDEPGDDPTAPYRVQHCIATGVERIVAALLGVSWNEYSREIESL